MRRKSLTQEQKNYSQVVERSEYEESMWKKGNKYCTVFILLLLLLQSNGGSWEGKSGN